MKSDVDPKTIQAFIIDLDGVIWRGESLLPGVEPFFEELKMRSIPYMFATNNATTTPHAMVQRAQKMGIKITPEQIITSSQAAVNFLRKQLPQGSSILMIGENGLNEALSEASFHISTSGKNADAVVVGMDREITWRKMAEAAYAISSGALFLGTNSDPSFPTERGLAPGNGAILYALQMTTGIEPIVVGKPEPYLFLQALDQLKTLPEQTLVLGDRLTTDIQGGINAGILTALILTGVTSQEDLKDSAIQPHIIFENLNHLIRDFWVNPAQS
jgi:4-nitrophenyl phosphatase